MSPCEIRGNMIVCSRGAKRPSKCAFCQNVSTKLCDYPLDKHHTCDMPMCDDHAKHHGLNVDTCPNHPSMRYF